MGNNKNQWFTAVRERLTGGEQRAREKLYQEIREAIDRKDVLELAPKGSLIARNTEDAADRYYAKGNMLEKLPYVDNYFDVVIVDSPHTLAEGDAAMAEIDRVLKRNGILIALLFERKRPGLRQQMLTMVNGVRLGHQQERKALMDFLHEHGWRVKRGRTFAAVVPLTYMECIRKEPKR